MKNYIISYVKNRSIWWVKEYHHISPWTLASCDPHLFSHRRTALSSDTPRTTSTKVEAKDMWQMWTAKRQHLRRFPFKWMACCAVSPLFLSFHLTIQPQGSTTPSRRGFNSKRVGNMFASWLFGPGFINQFKHSQPSCAGGHQGFWISWFYPLHFRVRMPWSIYMEPWWIRME